METRSLKLDSLRGIAILIVVLGHAIQASLPLGTTSILHSQLIIPMQMPFLMLLSGYALGFSFPTNDPKRFILKKMKRLLLPYVVWSLIYYIITRIVSGRNLSIGGIVHELFHSNFWFLRQLFVNFLFVWVVNIACNFLSEKLNRDYQIILLTVSVPVVAMLSKISILSKSVNGWHYIWFLIGYACFRIFSCKEMTKVKKIWSWLSKVIIVVGILIAVFIYNGTKLHFRISTVIFILFVCACNELLFEVVQKEKICFLGILGENTLPIYAIHWCVLFAPFFVSGAYTALHGIPVWILTLTLFVSWTLVSVILGKAIEKSRCISLVLLGK